uniref:D-inositol-3-phosphate glycosyltransferase n=1 Tax=Candidatus Methanogaster sp. ANME-2c ERB4 TaxID=2759911 RepID=A0A7G9Y444_9EURY|nr:D-inositol-3-phosphate glycosyltransferase [Methanosarcinales archaeon ANME-2c ERB4]QNO42778.1 D-inositol-3-phosphate glycosyltransferase [Methanosarcinales archaeon ANME-2c ERB4]
MTQRLKVAYVLSFFPRLSQSFVLNEIVELIRSGHDVQIFPWFHSSETVIHEEIKDYQLLNRTHYFAIKQIFKKNPFRFLKYFVKTVRYSLAAKQISKSELKMDLQLAYFATVIEEKNIELIHAHFADMGNAARRLGKMLRLPYTLTAHAFDIYMDPDTDELREVMNDAESVITISEYNKNYLISEIGVNNRIEVIRCGIDLDKFNPQKNLKAYGRIKLLTVARLVAKKGLAYLIKAIPMVVKKMPNCELTIIGSGPQYGNLQHLVRDPDIESYVQFRGDVSDSELMRYYDDVDMFILPCIVIENGDRDGIPVAMMEAMTMELPVISTTVSGIPELVEDGASGILVSPKDEKAIADAIITLCKDSELRVKMGKKGREIIKREYNIASEAEKLIGVFENVAKHR